MFYANSGLLCSMHPETAPNVRCRWIAAAQFLPHIEIVVNNGSGSTIPKLEEYIFNITSKVIVHDKTYTGHAVQDLEKGETRAFKQARGFYEGLADRLVASGHALDVFACSLDQVGLDEMRPAVASTGVGP